VQAHNVAAGPPALAGLVVAITADRKGPELQASLVRLGARVIWGSTMRAVPPEVDDLLAAETAALVTADPPWFAVSTGSGLRAWLSAAQHSGQREQVEALLRRTKTVARGAKSHGALRGIGVQPVFVSAKETMDDVCSWLSARAGHRELLGAQVHGGEVIGTLDNLRPRVGGILTVAPYRWVLPEDLTAAERVVDSLIAGEVDILVQTSAPSCRNLFAVAAATGHRPALLRALRGDICVAAVGPVTARAFEEVGVGIDVMPQRPRTADLLRALCQWVTVRALNEPEPHAAQNGIELVPAATAIRIGPDVIRLGRQEFAVLAAMVRRPQVVLRPEDLALQAWGHRMPDDVRQVRHEIARIRRKLDRHGHYLETVRNVGYRYNPVPDEVDPQIRS
jgi:uroporphyrinogen-III synthase